MKNDHLSGGSSSADGRHLRYTLLPAEPSSLPPFQILHRAPRVLGGEVASSWNYRIAALYGWSANAVSQHLCSTNEPASLDHGYYALSASHSQRIAFLTSNDAAAVANAYSLATADLECSDREALYEIGRSPIYRFCPLCLATDSAPYFRLEWRLASTVHCSKHMVALLDHCPACLNHIHLGGPRRVQLTKAVRHEALRYCRICLAPLAAQKTARVPPVLRKTLGDFQSCVFSVASRGFGYDTAGNPLSAKDWLRRFAFARRYQPILKITTTKNPYTKVGEKFVLDWKRVLGDRHYETFREWVEGKLKTACAERPHVSPEKAVSHRCSVGRNQC